MKANPFLFWFLFLLISVLLGLENTTPPQTGTILLLMTLTRRESLANGWFKYPSGHWGRKFWYGQSTPLPPPAEPSLVRPNASFYLLSYLVGYYLLGRFSSMMGQFAFLGHFGHLAMVVVPIGLVIAGLNLGALAHQIGNLFPLMWVPDTMKIKAKTTARSWFSVAIGYLEQTCQAKKAPVVAVPESLLVMLQHVVPAKSLVVESYEFPLVPIVCDCPVLPDAVQEMIERYFQEHPASLAAVCTTEEKKDPAEVATFAENKSTSDIFLDTGASENFMIVETADLLQLTYRPGMLVRGGKCQMFPSFQLKKPVTFVVVRQSFTVRFSICSTLMYPIILVVGWWWDHNVSILLKENELQVDHSSGIIICIPLLGMSELEQSSQTIQSVPVPTPVSLDLPTCLQPWYKAFDTTRDEALPKHTQFNFDFKVTIDLICIVSPIYPLTLKEDKFL
ncbi:hypothetical protein DSO57_1001972 [Entomophthora muscae]|uniref:Uncharacterized protein n=1 Tax=Entomophthora muscae TaxID=34485 RepID=A0ACC2RNN8_9FUNG|nr:hypothetical protein DSO57_1001972 [Entomophthora muscae]